MAHHQEITTEYGVSTKTVKTYITGLLGSLLLTVLAFVLVGKHLLSTHAIYIGITLLAIAQLFVQVTCFLGVNATNKGRWNLMPFLFTILIVLVVVFGSIWIMVNLNYNMVH